MTEANTHLGPLYEKVRPLLSAGITIEKAKAVANDMLAGAGSNNLQTMARYIGSLPGGVPFANAADKYATSGQLFEAYMRQMLAPMRAIVAGNNNQSNVELETSLKALGATRDLQRGTINALLDHAKDMNFEGLHNFQREKSSFAIGDPNDRFVQNRRTTLDTRFPTELQNNLPAGVIELFRQNYADDPKQAMDHLDASMHAPGLAAQIVKKYKIGQ
jgi:hypothetical protein